MIEVYDLSAEEAIEVWQNIRGECAAWGEYREFANKSLKYWIQESLKDAVERKIYALITRQNRVWREGCLPNFTHSA